MPIPYLLLRPDNSSYGFRPGQEVIGIALDGGKAFYRRDKVNATSTVNVQWVLTREEYSYLWAFYRSELLDGSLSFYMDLITDRDTVERHLCHFAPNTVPTLVEQKGLAYTVTASLEVEKSFEDPARNVIIVGFFELEQHIKLQLRFHQNIFSDYSAFDWQATGNVVTNTPFTSDPDRGRTYAPTTDDDFIEVVGAVMPAGHSYSITMWTRRPFAGGSPILFDAASGPVLRFFISDGGFSGGHGATHVSSGPGADDVWQHFGVTWDSVTGEMNLFINGVVVDTASSVPAYGTGVVTVNVGGTGANNGILGRLDDVRMYDVALSPDQVKKIYDDTTHVSFTLNNPGP